MKKIRKIIAVLFSTMLILSMSMQSFAATRYYTLSNGVLLGTLNYSRTSSSVNLELKVVKNSAGYNMYNGSVEAWVYYTEKTGNHSSNYYSDYVYTSEKVNAVIDRNLKENSTINVVNVTAKIYNKSISLSY